MYSSCLYNFLFENVEWLLQWSKSPSESADSPTSGDHVVIKFIDVLMYAYRTLVARGYGLGVGQLYDG